ncbi:hypothetical protein HYV50_03790 [Candidatus Pacearchaeota archaeon]|nr:hypothetical protein [Candidatus Pacearchaeota archaeon]
MTERININKGIIEELFKKAENNVRCPFIRKDSVGPYCSKGLNEKSNISQERRMVCDIYSLQLYCLSESYPNCIYYQGEEF